jgi:hypothetical protein
MDRSKEPRSSRRLVVVAVLASTLGALAACQQLLGLDKLKNCDQGECDASALPEDGSTDGTTPDGGPDASTDASTDARPDVFLPPFPDGSTGSDWVNFRMPYADGGRLDGSESPLGQGDFRYNPLARDLHTFDLKVIEGVSVADDLVTTRRWLVTSGNQKPSFDRAKEECALLKARVPSRIELLSLLDPGQRGDAGMVRPEVLEVGVNISNLAFWSSTANREADGGISFWIVDFAQGRTRRAMGGSFGVLCVR